MRKIIISVAPVKAGTNINYVKLSEEITKCINKGAAVCHLHTRDENGQLISDPKYMLDCFQRVITKCDFIAQASTGGISEMSIEERCSALSYPIISSCSLNGGTTNLGEEVYVNTFDDIRYVSRRAYEEGLHAEIEVFDISMIHVVESILTEKNISIPKMYNLVLGHPGGTPATIENLIAFKNFVPKDTPWSITVYQRINWDLIACAISMGACCIRVGFEDSDVRTDKTIAKNNSEIIEDLVNLIKAMGHEVANVDVARQILGIKEGVDKCYE